MNLKTAFVKDNLSAKVKYKAMGNSGIGEIKETNVNTEVNYLATWFSGNITRSSFLEGFKGYYSMNLQELKEEMENKLGYSDIVFGTEKRELEFGEDYDLDLEVTSNTIDYTLKVKKGVDIKAISFKTVYVDELR